MQRPARWVLFSNGCPRSDAWSRRERRLRLPGEQEFAVGPLPTPAAASLDELLGNESVQLFVDRAQGVQPDFQLAAGNSTAVAHLCRRLDGIPLAIELAAGRLNVLTPAQLLERLGKVDLLTSRIRHDEDRHRSLYAAVEWSYSLLSPELKRFFARLSVFHGGWTAEAAEAICDEPLALDYLAQLVECSLIVLDRDAVPEPRFRMLEILREYATGRLGESGEAGTWRERHLEFFLELVTKTATLWGEHEWFERLRTDHANLLSALEYCNHAPDGVWKALGLVGELWAFWLHSGLTDLCQSEVLRALNMDAGAKPTRERIRALHGAGAVAATKGDTTAALHALRQGLDLSRLLGDKHMTAVSLIELGVAEIDSGRLAAARSHVSEALGLFRELRNQRSTAKSLCQLGRIAEQEGDYERARRFLEESLKCLDLGNWPLSRIRTLSGLAGVAFAEDDFDHAEAHWLEVRALARRMGTPSWEAAALNQLALVARARGDPGLAISRLHEAIIIRRKLNEPNGLAACLVNLVGLSAETGDLAAGRTQLAECLSLALRATPYRPDLGPRGYKPLRTRGVPCWPGSRGRPRATLSRCAPQCRSPVPA